MTLAVLLAGCAFPVSHTGAGNMAVVVERSSGSIQLLDHVKRVNLGRIDGLGDLSHASLVYSPDRRYVFVFGRDGGLTKVDLHAMKIVRRVMQAGNSIGGAISRDGRLVAVANYQPGGVKIFDAASLDELAEIPSSYGTQGERAKVVGIADAPGSRFVFSLFEAGEIWVADVSNPRHPVVQKHRDVGKLPYDALITPDGRHYIAGLFGEDGLAMLDLDASQGRVRRIMDGYGRNGEKLPVYKMPHLRGWAVAGAYAFLPAIGRNEVLVVDTRDWRPVAQIASHGQPVFAMARPDGRQVWVNFAFPLNDTVQVIDVGQLSVVQTLKPGRSILHMEFNASGSEIWLSSRDDDRIVAYETDSYTRLVELPARSPSGIFFSDRAGKTGM